MLRKALFSSLVVLAFCLSALAPEASAAGRIAVRTSAGILVSGAMVIDMGSVPLNTPVEKTFFIYNEGDMPITLGAPPVEIFPSAQIFVSSPPGSLWIPPAFSTSFTIRFVSPFPGTFNSTANIKYSDSVYQNLNFTFYLKGTALGPGLNVVAGDGTSILPNSTYTFPTTSAGTSVSRAFNIANTGNSPLTISNFSLSTAGGFVVLELPPSSIAAGQTGSFRIRLLSASPGTYTGTVAFNTNVPSFPTFQFNLRGTVGTADIRVAGPGGVTLVNGSLFIMPSTPVSTSISRLFTIYNDGNAPLVISNPASLVSGQSFSLIVQPPATINPGSSGDFRVRLLSSVAGTYTGTVTILSNDPDESPLAFSLKGTVTP